MVLTRRLVPTALLAVWLLYACGYSPTAPGADRTAPGMESAPIARTILDLTDQQKEIRP